jgi:hypothetical protein
MGADYLNMRSIQLRPARRRALSLDSGRALGLHRPMARLLALIVTCALCLGGCGPDLAALDARIAAEQRDTGYPELVPLGPLLETVYADPPQAATREGPTIEERAAELRRRADRLRSLPL